MSSDVIRRNADRTWVLHPIAEGGQLEIEYRQLRCPLEAVYEDVAFD